MQTDAASPRKVAVASAVGATIEWYDFFLYGTAAGLVFDQLFFSGLSGPAAQFAAFGTFAVGFLARPLGGFIFGHFGDRIGRKTMLIWTLVIMGVGTARDRPAAVVRPDRRLGAHPAGGAADPAGHRRRRRVRRRRAARRRVRAGRAPGLLRQLRAHRRTRRPVPRLRRVRDRQPAARRGVPGLGLARLLPAQRRAARDRRVDPAQRHGDPGVRQGAGGARRSPRCRSRSCSAGSRAPCCSAWAPASSRASRSTCSRSTCSPTPSRPSACRGRRCSTRSWPARSSAWCW